MNWDLLKNSLKLLLTKTSSQYKIRICTFFIHVLDHVQSFETALIKVVIWSSVDQMTKHKVQILGMEWSSVSLLCLAAVATSWAPDPMVHISFKFHKFITTLHIGYPLCQADYFLERSLEWTVMTFLKYIKRDAKCTKFIYSKNRSGTNYIAMVNNRMIESKRDHLTLKVPTFDYLLKNTSKSDQYLERWSLKLIILTRTWVRYLSFRNSMVRTSHRPSEGCGFILCLGSRNRFSEVWA